MDTSSPDRRSVLSESFVVAYASHGRISASTGAASNSADLVVIHQNGPTSRYCRTPGGQLQQEPRSRSSSCLGRFDCIRSTIHPPFPTRRVAARWRLRAVKVVDSAPISSCVNCDGSGRHGSTSRAVGMVTASSAPGGSNSTAPWQRRWSRSVRPTRPASEGAQPDPHGHSVVFDVNVLVQAIASGSGPDSRARRSSGDTGGVGQAPTAEEGRRGRRCGRPPTF